MSSNNPYGGPSGTVARSRVGSARAWAVAGTVRVSAAAGPGSPSTGSGYSFGPFTPDREFLSPARTDRLPAGTAQDQRSPRRRPRAKAKS